MRYHKSLSSVISTLKEENDIRTERIALIPLRHINHNVLEIRNTYSSI